jgi:uncharacterized phiE125 gp8 family phage protein
MAARTRLVEFAQSIRSARMSSILLTPAAAEPLTLADAKSYLRVAHTDDDAVITALIAAARSHVEAQTRRALITQAWRLIRDGWPPEGRIVVSPAPLRSVSAVRTYDTSGATHAIDPAVFVLDSGAATLNFMPATLAPPGRIAAGIEIDVTVGYGDAPSDVPEALRQALLLLICHWYENRGLIAIGHAIAVLPATIAALIAPYRVLAL